VHTSDGIEDLTMAKFFLGIIACLLAFYFLNGGSVSDVFTSLQHIGAYIADLTVSKVKTQ
jgi:hypothetical protein